MTSFRSLLRPVAVLMLLSAGISSSISAADTAPIASERDGHGTATTPILPGAAVSAGKDASVLTLVGAPNSTITMAPGTVVSLDTRTDAAGISLLIHILAGTIQVDIGDKGVYTDIHTLAAAIDVRVTGTLFVVERQKHDTDYVALIRGHIRVKLRDDVADLIAGQRNDPVDLQAHQGIGGSAAGLTGVDNLITRPQLPSGDAGTSVRDQATTPSTDGNWNTDIASTLTAPDTGGDAGTPGVPPAVTDEISNQVQTMVTRNIVEQVTDQVIQNTVAPPGPASPLSDPPGPPSH